MRNIAFAGAILLAIAAHAQQARIAPQPRPAVSALLDQFEQYPIVALSEGPHTNQAGHDFRMALVRDPRFAELVNDVVVEFGNALYQPVMDRYTAGEDVPYRELRQVWENTTIPGAIWDSPIYAEFFKAIRDVNRANGSRIRVLLGDPPVDWATIRTAGEVNRNYGLRDTHPAKVIQEEVLKKNRRALIVYGEGHILNGGFGGPTMVGILRTESQARIFAISNGYPDLSRFETDGAWPVPSLILVKGTTVGPVRTAAGTQLEEDFDAVLHLGGPSALIMTDPPKSVCDDAEYVKMRLERYAIAASPGDANPGGELRELCGR